MRDDDRRSASGTPACLIQAFQHLLTVCCRWQQDRASRMFGLTVRSASRRDSSPDSFQNISRRALSISALADFSICISPGLQNGVRRPVTQRSQFAAGVAIHGAELTVEGFKLDTGGRFICRFYLTACGRRRRQEAVVAVSAPALPRARIQFDQRRYHGRRLFFNSEISCCCGIAGRIGISPLRMSGCSHGNKLRIFARQGYVTFKRDSTAVFRQAGKCSTSVMVGRRQHRQVVALIVTG